MKTSNQKSEQIREGQRASWKGLRGRFGMYIPPLMEALGLAELTHIAKGNKMKAR